jgi:hypothetical protein
MISPKMANSFKIGNQIKTEKGTYTITGFGSKTGATRDFEAENEKGEKFNLRVSLRGATGIQVAVGARNLNFPEKEEMLESVINEAARVPSNVMEFAKRKGSYATALVKKAATWAEKAGKYISNGTAIGKNYSTIILDMKYHGSEIYINLDNETIELFGEEVTDAKSFAKVLATNESVEVNEAGDAGKFVTGTLNTPFDTLKIGDLIKLDALDYTRRGDDEKITCILPDGNKAEVLKKHITVKL